MMDFDQSGTASLCMSVWVVCARMGMSCSKSFHAKYIFFQDNLSIHKTPKNYRFSNNNTKVSYIKTLVYHINTDLVITCNFLFEILPCGENF